MTATPHGLDGWDWLVSHVQHSPSLTPRVGVGVGVGEERGAACGSQGSRGLWRAGNRNRNRRHRGVSKQASKQASE